MRIAIVDDIASDRLFLRRQLDILLKRLALNGQILEFDTGASFLSEARRNSFDLIFLDIYIGEENGIDTAKSLRLFDPDCLLVFTTSSADHALEGFRVRAMQYLVKPYTQNDLSDLFHEITKRFPASEPYIQVNKGSKTVRLRFCEILYAEHYKHQIFIHTKDGRRFAIRRTFREFAESITDERFFLCGRGLIINLEHAADFDGSDFILKNGNRLPVSRSLLKDARLAFGDFLFRKGGRL